jgi:hypothetical protein
VVLVDIGFRLAGGGIAAEESLAPGAEKAEPFGTAGGEAAENLQDRETRLKLVLLRGGAYTVLPASIRHQHKITPGRDVINLSPTSQYTVEQAGTSTFPHSSLDLGISECYNASRIPLTPSTWMKRYE